MPAIETAERLRRNQRRPGALRFGIGTGNPGKRRGFSASTGKRGDTRTGWLKAQSRANPSLGQFPSADRGLEPPVGLVYLTVQRASRSFWRSLAGLFAHSLGMQPPLISRLSPSVLRCFGAATIASMIWPLIARTRRPTAPRQSGRRNLDCRFTRAALLRILDQEPAFGGGKCGFDPAQGPSHGAPGCSHVAAPRRATRHEIPLSPGPSSSFGGPRRP